MLWGILATMSDVRTLFSRDAISQDRYVSQKNAWSAMNDIRTEIIDAGKDFQSHYKYVPLCLQIARRANYPVANHIVTFREKEPVIDPKGWLDSEKFDWIEQRTFKPLNGEVKHLSAHHAVVTCVDSMLAGGINRDQLWLGEGDTPDEFFEIFFRHLQELDDLQELYSRIRCFPEGSLYGCVELFQTFEAEMIGIADYFGLLRTGEVNLPTIELLKWLASKPGIEPQTGRTLETPSPYTKGAVLRACEWLEKPSHRANYRSFDAITKSLGYEFKRTTRIPYEVLVAIVLVIITDKKKRDGEADKAEIFLAKIKSENSNYS